jgi:hypothetical protein
MIINLILISLILVWIIDLTDIIDSMESGLSKWLKGRARIPKPFSCSLCMTFWCGIIYLLCTNEFTIPTMALVCLLSFLTPIMKNLLELVRDSINNLLDLIYRALIN